MRSSRNWKKPEGSSDLPNGLTAMLKQVELLLDFGSRVLAQVATLTLWVLTGFVVLSAIMRYFLRRPFNFTEELVGFLFLASVFLAIPSTTVRREHINVPLLVNVLTPKLRKIAEVIAALVMIAFAAVFTWESWKFTAFSFEIDARSEQMELPVGIWQAAMPIGIGLMGVVAIVRLLIFFMPGASSERSDEPSSSSPL
jgi:TRAP-type C4-dicarboxylate transport system permease small subunit